MGSVRSLTYVSCNLTNDSCNLANGSCYPADPRCCLDPDICCPAIHICSLRSAFDGLQLFLVTRHARRASLQTCFASRQAPPGRCQMSRAKCHVPCGRPTNVKPVTCPPPAPPSAFSLCVSAIHFRLRTGTDPARLSRPRPISAALDGSGIEVIKSKRSRKTP